MFSFDAMIASIILLSILFLLLFSLNAFAEQEVKNEKEIEKELFGLALSEAIIKNRNEKNPINGAAYYNIEKKRVEANIIDISLLEKIQPKDFGKFSLASLYERIEHGKRYYFENNNENCIAIERFVIIKEIIPRKTVLGVVICE